MRFCCKLLLSGDKVLLRVLCQQSICAWPSKPSHSLSICLSVYMSICLSVYMSICLSAYLSICLYVYMSICLYVYLSICLSAYLSICLYVYLSICLSVYLSICLSVYLSIRLYVHVVFKVTVAELEIYKLSLKAPQKTEAKERVTAERASGNWLFHHCRTNGFLSAAIKLITCRCIWLINDEPLWNRPHPHPHPPSTHCHFTRQQCNYLIVDYLRFLYQHMFPVGARIAFHCDFHWIDYQLYP